MYRNKRLHDKVEYLTRKLYGRITEKTSSLSLEQMSLFDEAEILADPAALEPDLALDKQDCFCEACSTELVSIGKNSSELACQLTLLCEEIKIDRTS